MSVRQFVRRWVSDARGAAAVEGALCLPILTMLVGGIFWFGWSQHQASTMRYALEGAARQLVINPDLTEDQLEDMVEAQMGAQSTNVNLTLAVANVTGGRRATVTANYATSIVIPAAGTFPITRSEVVKAYLPVT